MNFLNAPKNKNLQLNMRTPQYKLANQSIET